MECQHLPPRQAGLRYQKQKPRRRVGRRCDNSPISQEDALREKEVTTGSGATEPAEYRRLWGIGECSTAERKNDHDAR
jgi:hypothetical protein